MAASDTPVFEVNPNSPPRPFAVASWLGMRPEEIMAGLADGSIMPPPGARPEWRPPGLNPEPSATAPIGPPGRAQVQSWFQALDSTLTNAAFDGIWNRAGESDATRANGLTGYLARTLLGSALVQAADGDSAAANQATQIAGALSAYTADPSHRARVVDLVGMSGATLTELARTDIGYRYALSSLDSIALAGNRAIFAGVDSDSSLDRFDPDTGESQLSDAWLSDRGKFLAWKMAGDAGNEFTIDGAQNWSFTDLAETDALGKPLTLKLAASGNSDVENQVIFGTDGAESVQGKRDTDRIYGGRGDDVLRGGAGADLLDGGQGDDFILGGSGDDEVTGNQGNDDLDGGRGADGLDGGSGDDTLAGGRGDDRLAGGDGADSYVFDAGDGTDTIIDSDGQGTITVDDVAITGGTQAQNDTWTSSDGRIDYSIDGDLSGESTLTIRAFATDADHGGNLDNVVQVRNWHNGDLGITLGANASGGQSDGSPTLAAPDSGPQVIADTFPGDAMSSPAAGGDPVSASIESNVGASPTLGQAPASDAPPPNVMPSDQSLDIDHALQQLLRPSSDSMTTVEPLRLQRAIAAFGGVPTPPDVSFSAAMGGAAETNAVSIADVTDALAGDAGGHDLGHESAAGLVPTAPDWHGINDALLPIHGFPQGARDGAGARR